MSSSGVGASAGQSITEANSARRRVLALCKHSTVLEEPSDNRADPQHVLRRPRRIPDKSCNKFATISERVDTLAWGE